jgi:hypothetical protein
MRKICLLSFFTLFIQSVLAVSLPDRSSAPVLKPFPGRLRFSENKGQVADNDGKPQPHVLFAAHDHGVKVFLTKSGIIYTYFRFAPGGERKGDASRGQLGKYAHHGGSGEVTTFQMNMHLVGANPRTILRAEEPGADLASYYPAPSAAGITGIRNFGRIVYENVYPHIDLVLYAQEAQLKYDFIVKPGGKVSDIRIQYTGSQGMHLRPDGSLLIKNPLGSLSEGKPYTYQRVAGRQKEVKTVYRINGDTLGFAVDRTGFNPALPLVIDPTLVWATYYGGEGEERIYGVTTDAAGNVLLMGETNSLSGISVAGHQNTYGGSTRDAFLVKFNAAGQRLWATYYGGGGTEDPAGLATDTAGNVYLAGTTLGSDNLAAGGHLNTYHFNPKAFLVKFSPDGTRLWGTYYGVDGYETGLDVCTDPAGNVYLAGISSSNTGIATAGAHQLLRSSIVGNDAFLVKFNPAGTRLWATYYGGSANEEYAAVCTDPAGNVYLAGTTESTGNIAAGPQNTFFRGGFTDAFLAKFNAAGVRQWGQYFGSAGTERSKDVACDPAGNVYLAGESIQSGGLPTGFGHQPLPGGSWDGFLVRYEPGGNRVWATHYGGTGIDRGESVTTDALGHVYLAGSTSSTTGMASGGIDNIQDGGMDAYLVKFEGSGRRVWGTYLGGLNGELLFSNSVAVRGTDVYVAFASDSPAGVAANGHQDAYGGGPFDGVLVKLHEPFPTPSVTNATPATGVPGTSVSVWGNHFTGATHVEFNGVSAAFTVNNVNVITATVPAGATTGRVRVTGPGGTGVSTFHFTVPQPPAITGFTPGFAATGRAVTISGANFTGATRVEFNGTSASFTVNSATQITATVPTGTASGPIRVTNAIGTATSTQWFYLPPSLTSFFPAEGKTGTQVTLSGSHLSTATAVLFNGTPAVFSAYSAWTLLVTVPAGATTGPIQVVTPGGRATGTQPFAVVYPPVLTGFSPASGTANTVVAITGSHLTHVTAVRFNGLSAAFTVHGDGHLTATVPVDATSGPLSVTNLAGSAASAAAFTVIPSPKLLSHVPRKHETKAAPAAPLRFSFSEPMAQAAASAASIKVHSAFGGLRSGTGTFTGAGTDSVAFTPRSPFYPGDKVSVSVTPNAQNPAGIPLARPTVYSYTARPGVGPGTFIAAPPVTTPGAAKSVLPADLDGDGDIDLAISNATGGAISIRLNDGKGHFAAHAEVPAVGTPGLLRGADFDGDGDVDLACYRYSAGIGIFKNDGTGTFTLSASTEAIPTTSPAPFCPVDFDGDGDVDLAAVGTGNFIAFRNDGSGNFSRHYTTTGMGISYLWYLRLWSGDLDGDGDVDLVSCAIYSNSSTVLLYENDGTGRYTPKTSPSLPPTDGTEYVEMGDFNADGALDLAFIAGATFDGDEAYLCLNDGTGKFTTVSSTITYAGISLETICTGDFNGDGLPDLATGNADRTLSFYPNRGPVLGGMLRNPTKFNVNATLSEMYAADLDGDKDLDILSADLGERYVNVFLNNVTAPPAITAFTPSGRVPGYAVTIRGTDFWAASSVQFNGVAAEFTLVSGTEIVARVPAGATTGPVSVTTPNGTAYSTGNFTVYAGPYPTLTALAPAPNAAHADATAVTLQFGLPMWATAPSPGGVHVYGSQTGSRTVAGTHGFAGDGTRALSFTPALPFRPGEEVQVTIGEKTVNAAGTPLERPYVYTYRTATGPAPLSFRAHPPVYLETSPASVCTADFDGDGSVDVATANRAGGWVMVCLNDGAGILSKPVTIRVGSTPRAIHAADLDGDGDPDLAAGNEDGTIAILQNGGGGRFAIKSKLRAPQGVHEVTSADFDGDGDLDLASANYGCSSCTNMSNTASVYWNDGAGNFPARTDLVTAIHPCAVAAGDFNGDGSMDLAVANASDNSISLFLNNRLGEFLPAQRLTTGSSIPGRLWAGDLDGDLDVDLLTYFPYYGSSNADVLLYRNDGKGNYVRTVLLQATYVQPGDYDGDGDLDLACRRDLTNAVTIRLNDGSANFPTSSTVMPGFNSGLLGTADFDSDGTADLLAATGELNYSAGSLQILLNPSPLPRTTLSSIAPTRGVAGTPVAIRGSHFTGTTAVRFNGVPAASFTVVSDSEIVARAPAGAGRGNVVVFAPGGAAVSSTAFELIVPNPFAVVPSPLPYTHQAPATAPVSFSFREAMSPQTASGEAVRVFGGLTGLRSPAGSGTFSGGGTSQISFRPPASFLAGERVSVTLTTAAARLDGVPLDKPYVYSFRTATAPSDLSAFAAQPPVHEGGYGFVCPADFNGDGSVDFTVSTSADGGLTYTLSVRFNDGMGQFTPAHAIASIREVAGTMAADLDNDGDMDLVVLSQSPHGGDDFCWTYLNDGQGRFTLKTKMTVGSGPRDLQAVDLEGDGDLDLVMLNAHNDNRVFLLRNDGSANFSAAHLAVTAEWRASGVKMADFNGDGAVDMGVLWWVVNGEKRFTPWLNDGRGNFTEDNATHLSSGLEEMLVDDYDGDADADVALVHKGTVHLLVNDGVGNFSLRNGSQPALTEQYQHVADADFDGDGDVDLIAGVSAQRFYLFLNDGKGTFANPVAYPLAGNALHPRPADLDGDGDMDFFAADHAKFTVYVVLNEGKYNPQITGLSPGAGAPGTTVAIAGTGFDRASQVSFNGVEAPFEVISSTSIRATVPAGATSGTVTVRVADQVLASPEAFHVPPQSPAGLTATRTAAAGVRLQWQDQSDDETGFEVYRAGDTAGAFVKIASLPAGVAAFEDAGLLPATTYHYQVRAVNAGGSSAFSNEASATTLPAPPLPPSALAAVATTGTQVTLTWADQADAGTGFEVYRAATPDGPYEKIATLPAGTGSYRDDALAAGNAYYYALVATNEGGRSGFSGQASATLPPSPPPVVSIPPVVPTPPVVPAPPAALTVTAFSLTGAALQWNVPPAGADGFVIERSAGDSTHFEAIASVDAGVTHYQDTTLRSGMTYYYRVRATQGVAQSAASNTVWVNPAALLVAPAGLTATPVSSGWIDIAWEDGSTRENGFVLERSLGDPWHYEERVRLGADVTAFRDTNLTAGTTYHYRVKAVYPLGHSGYSPEAAATTPGYASPAAAIRVYPNPGLDVVNVTVDSPDEGPLRIAVVNEIGVVVQTFSLLKGREKTTFALRLESLRKGVYYLQIVTQQGTAIKPWLKY